MGVWIETQHLVGEAVDIKSHPAWVCGLKQKGNKVITTILRSHPAWVCGLKPLMSCKVLHSDYVTPCVGVWIETTLWVSTVPSISSHPAWVCGLKPNSKSFLIQGDCHTLRGCVD